MMLRLISKESEEGLLGKGALWWWSGRFLRKGSRCIRETKELGCASGIREPRSREWKESV